jgi:hypothetical protein
LKSAKFVAIASKGDVQKNTIPLFFFRLRKNFKRLDSFRQDASLEPTKLYLAQFREIAKIKKKILFLHMILATVDYFRLLVSGLGQMTLL